MSSKQPRRTSSVRQTENKPSHTGTITVAVIGGIATIIGAVLAGLFGIVQTRTQLEIPIYATQTAEARLTATADAQLLVANSSQSQSSTAPTSAPNPTSTASTAPTSAPNPTSTIVPASPSAAPTETPSQVSKDWKDLVRVDDFAPRLCPLLRVMPEYITPDQDLATARDQLFQAEKQGELLKWPAGPVQIGDLNGVHPQLFKLNNITTGKEWIWIDHTVHVRVVTRTKIVPDHVNIISIGQCGATGKNQVFPDIDLQSNLIRYDADTTLNDVDHLKIPPGDFEMLDFHFKCRAPGIYQLRFEIPYSYSGQDGSITVDSATVLMCPKSFTIWLYGAADTEPYFHGKYTWNGTAYESAP
jgi:hypothetical protein